MSDDIKSFRFNPDERKLIIEHAAVKCANKYGLASVRHAKVAEYCPIKTSLGTVRRYFPRKHDLILLVLNSELAVNKKVYDTAKKLGYEMT